MTKSGQLHEKEKIEYTNKCAKEATYEVLSLKTKQLM